MNINKIVFGLFASVLMLMSLLVLPLQFLETKQLAGNPEGCPFYITLQASLANYKMFASDKANAGYIKQRLVDFEGAVSANQSSSAALVAKYQTRYQQQLKKFSLDSIRNVKDTSQLLLVARAVAPVVDGYYLDKKVSCVNPLLKWKSNDVKRILQYNMGGLYDQLPDINSRILFSVESCPQLGAFPGFFVNNQSTTLGTQFMTGAPLLSALYVLPKYNYDKIGTYNGLVPWCAFNAEFISDKLNRKLMNIAGMDIITISKNELVRKSSKFKIEAEPGIKPIPQKNIYPRFDEGYRNYSNLQSYGMAYLAARVNYVDESHVLPHEKAINKYFSRPERLHPAAFTEATYALYDQLKTLHGKGDILLESADHHALSSVPAKVSFAGTAHVLGMVGERAVIATECTRKTCTMVLNLAKAPGWRAYVNDQPVRIERANFAFMAVTVPEGDAVVWFIYNSFANVFSYFLSAITMMLILIFSMKGMIGAAGRN